MFEFAEMTVPSSRRTVRTVAAVYSALFLLQISDLLRLLVLQNVFHLVSA